MLPTLENTCEKSYYMTLCGEQLNFILDTMDKEVGEITANDTIAIVLNKIRKRLLTITLFDKAIEQAKDIDRILAHLSQKETKAVGFLKTMTDQFHKNKQEMN